MQNHKTSASFECEVVTKRFDLVGQIRTAKFPEDFPDAAIELQKAFDRRVGEIKHVKDRSVAICPYMANDIVATYFACVEVEKMEDVPEDMIAFTLPETRYAKVACSNRTIQEGYGKIFAWMGEKGYIQKRFDNSSPVEIFYYGGGEEEIPVEILIPIQ